MENVKRHQRAEALPIMLIELHKDFVIINGITVPRPLVGQALTLRAAHEAFQPVHGVPLHAAVIQPEGKFVNGITVPRPARIKRSCWLKWWEART